MRTALNTAAMNYGAYKEQRVTSLSERAVGSLSLFPRRHRLPYSGYPVGVPGELPVDMSKLLRVRVVDGNVVLDFLGHGSVSLPPEVASCLVSDQRVRDSIKVKVAQCHALRQKVDKVDNQEAPAELTK